MSSRGKHEMGDCWPDNCVWCMSELADDDLPGMWSQSDLDYGPEEHRP